GGRLLRGCRARVLASLAGRGGEYADGGDPCPRAGVDGPARPAGLDTALRYGQTPRGPVPVRPPVDQSEQTAHGAVHLRTSARDGVARDRPCTGRCGSRARRFLAEHRSADRCQRAALRGPEGTHGAGAVGGPVCGRAPARAVPPAHQADVLHAVFGAVLPRAPGALVVPRPGGGPGPALPRRAGARAAAEACPAGAGGLIGPGAGLLNADAPVEPVPQPPTHGARWNVPARSKTERRTVGRRLEDAPTAAAVAPVDPGARGARPIHRRRTRLRVDPDTGHGLYPRSIRTRRGCVLHRLSPGTAHLLDHQYRGRAARAGAFAIAASVGGSGRDRGSSRADRAADDHVRVLRPVGKARGECVLG